VSRFLQQTSRCLQVYNSSRLQTGFGSMHLTSFGTGWFPEPNTIDFEYIYAHPSVSAICYVQMCAFIGSSYPSCVRK
jgi:hypothetical protein